MSDAVYGTVHGETITLPTFDLTGDEKAMTSEPIRLDNGVYTVKKYIAYNNKGVQVMEAYLESDNELVVEHESVTTFYFPISIRITYSNNMLRSTLFGICTEIFGNDSTLWPKTWRGKTFILKPMTTATSHTFQKSYSMKNSQPIPKKDLRE